MTSEELREEIRKIVFNTDDERLEFAAIMAFLSEHCAILAERELPLDLLRQPTLIDASKKLRKAGWRAVAEIKP